MPLISQWTKDGVLIQTINVAATNTTPSGITTDRKFLWVTDATAQQIEQYTKLGDFIQSFAAPVAQGVIQDITTDRKFLWYCDSANQLVVQLDKSGNFIQSWATTNIPYGITTDRKFIWTTESDKAANCWIRQYTKSGVLIQSISIIAFVKTFYPAGITTDRKFLWVVDNVSLLVHQFDKSGNHIQSWACSPGGEFPYGITTDRKFLWVTSAAQSLIPWLWDTEHTPDANTLLLHHHEDNLANTIVVDSSGNGWNSVDTANTNATYTAGGRFSGGFYPNKNDYDKNTVAACLAAVQAAVAAVITVEAWIKCDTNNWSAQGNQGFFMIDAGFWTNVVDVRYKSADDLVYFTYTAGGVVKTITTIGITDTIGWHHLAVTIDVAADEFKAFIDGVQVGLTQNGLGVWNLAVTGVWIGCDTVAGNPMDGVIDEFTISNVVRY
jgi:hypothetical protein